MTTQPAIAEKRAVGLMLLPHLLSLSKAVRQLVGLKLAEVGVSAGQDQFLLCFTEGEAVSVAGIAERLSVRASTVSKMTDILQRKGWVDRKPDEHDARKVLVQLTEAGQLARDAVRTIETRMEAELWSAVGTDNGIVPALAKLDDVLTKRLSRLR